MHHWSVERLSINTSVCALLVECKDDEMCAQLEGNVCVSLTGTACEIAS